MAFNWDLRIPWNYRDTYVTLAYARDELLKHYHPENVRRMLAWLHYKNGKVGIGSRWRATQPSKPGVAPEGKSFHQNQKFANGFIGAAAVDLIAADGPDPGTDHDGISWDDVPVQGSVESARWGLHCNVGDPSKPYPQGESWHMQWTDWAIGGYDLDGWATWVADGRPGIIPNYPLPAEHDPYPPQTFPPEVEQEFDVKTVSALPPFLMRLKGKAEVVYVVDGIPMLMPMPLAEAFGIADDVRAVIGTPIAYHPGVEQWLSYHGIMLTNSAGGV